MGIYSAKTSKFNYRKNRLKLGISLICIFSILLLLIAFDLVEIFTIICLGSIGLLFYPLCLFFITLGILITCNKPIKASKSIILLSIAWLCVFVLILQLATSSEIDTSFVNYIITTFKYNLTAGGVIFGVILYPFYYLTHTVATYIILSVILVVISAFLIDRIVIEVKQKASTTITDENINDKLIEDTEEMFEDDIPLKTIEKPTKNTQIDDDIFIEDEDEDKERNEAKDKLGLSKTRTIEDLEAIADADDEEDKVKNVAFTSHIYQQTTQTNKPSIIVHDELFESSQSNNNTITPEISEVEKKDEERKRAAREYLNISKGMFETKNLTKGIDNVSQNKPQEQSYSKPEITTESSLQEQTQENSNRLSRLNNLTERLNLFDKPKENVETNSSRNIYDENLTKKSFEANRENITQTITLPSHLQGGFGTPKKAQEVYSGEVKENIVEATGFRPVQVEMTEISKPKPAPKLYKKPPKYVKPPLDLLKKYPANLDVNNDVINANAEIIVSTLKNFKIDTKVVGVVTGPTFTLYEMQMAPGISVNTLNSKIDDLSMALKSSCRLQIPIPGKNAFGIEVPNKKRQIVGLRDILESSNFQTSKSPLTIALGKNISNECKVASIDKLVHTLVAGSTGSGKSVCLHTILISLLYKAGPEDLKLLLVDPKMVEFPLYNNLPHMLIPNAITECDKAVMALAWLVEEMERRYKRLNSVCARNIEGYNESQEVVSGTLPKMPYIVMVFDEVGDYMVIAKKEIEEKVVRLAAKSRACGIHLILTTQRPTVDVITGTIKTNLPSRIAFAVNSYQDSKTIIDSSGAESLLGMGDMLVSPKGSSDIERMQCAYVHDNELKAVVNFIKENNESDFDEQIEDEMFNKKEGFNPGSGVEDAFDPMLKPCLKYFIKSKKASASSLQGYFAMGYPKANKIVLQMEKAGFVSPGDHNGRRTLYITAEEFEERFGESIDE